MSRVPAPVFNDHFTALASNAFVAHQSLCAHHRTKYWAKSLSAASQLLQGEPLLLTPASMHARVLGPGRCTVNVLPHNWACQDTTSMPDASKLQGLNAQPGACAGFGLPGTQACYVPPGGTLTSAPMTPRLVRRRYSNGRVLLMVFRNGYRNIGMYAAHALCPLAPPQYRTHPAVDTEPCRHQYAEGAW